MCRGNHEATSRPPKSKRSRNPPGTVAAARSAAHTRMAPARIHVTSGATGSGFSDRRWRSRCRRHRGARPHLPAARPVPPFLSLNPLTRPPRSPPRVQARRRTRWTTPATPSPAPTGIKSTPLHTAAPAAPTTPRRGGRRRRGGVLIKETEGQSTGVYFAVSGLRREDGHLEELVEPLGLSPPRQQRPVGGGVEGAVRGLAGEEELQGLRRGGG